MKAVEDVGLAIFDLPGIDQHCEQAGQCGRHGLSKN
jgi:hypothetical protein